MTQEPPSPASSQTPVIDINNLRHVYKTHVAVAGVTFTVSAGSIHGFVGPNGAGKTTTLKVLATLMAPQSGSVRVFGKDIYAERKSTRRLIGYMPDHFSMYRQMTVFEYLDFFGAAYGLKSVERDKVISDVLALTDMEGRRNDFVQGLSRGMQQRVSLARVLVHDPQLLLLDEPASGLDPRARIELMEILQELRKLGKTIFISSHILSELAELCDGVTILDRGVVKYTGSMRGLMVGDAPTTAYVIELSAPHSAMSEALKQLPGVVEVRQVDPQSAKYQVAFDPAQLEPNAVLKCALGSGAAITGFAQEVKHLNQAFMDLTEAGVRS
jgi:ABC-2 type transport system ATP-binding protein